MVKDRKMFAGHRPSRHRRSGEEGRPREGARGWSQHELCVGSAGFPDMVRTEQAVMCMSWWTSSHRSHPQYIASATNCRDSGSRCATQALTHRLRNAASDTTFERPATGGRLTMYREFDRGARSRTGAPSLGFQAEIFCGTIRGTTNNSSIGKLGRTMACRLSSNPTLSAMGASAGSPLVRWINRLDRPLPSVSVLPVSANRDVFAWYLRSKNVVHFREAESCLPMQGSAMPSRGPKPIN
jgi:hypothetical protein